MIKFNDDERRSPFDSDMDNWQPRIGFAYDLRGDGKDVIRGGWGVYQDVGYTNANDVSSRDLQFSEGGQWTRSKTIDTFCPLGPYIATTDEIGDPQDLSIRCILNGEVMQDGTTSKMIFPVAELVSFLSQGMTLVPGDVIITGTPPGVGAARDPQVWLQAGDEVSIEIEGLGALTNPVETA